MFKEIAQEEKREGYRELCGTPHRMGDGKGGSRVVRFFCHQDECDTCRRLKGEGYRDRINGMIGAGKKVIAMRVSDDISEKLRKEISKDEYLCLPQNDGTDILFIDVSESPDAADSVCLDELSLDNFNWSEIARRVDGRKISGGFGKPAKKIVEDDDAESYEVTDTVYMFDDHVLAVEVLHEVIHITYAVQVASPELMQELVNKRNQMFEQMYKEKGGSIRMQFSRKMHVRGLDVNNSIVNDIEEKKTNDFNIKSFAEKQEEKLEIERNICRELFGTT